MAKRKRKRRRPTKRQKQTRTRLALAALALATAGIWTVVGPDLRELGGLAGTGPPARDGDSVRLVSWNLANFSGSASGHDLERMREVVDELDPDVLALQEIKDPEALAALLPEFELHLSSKGGRGRQLLGVAVRADRVELLTSGEHPELSVGGRVRPAFSAYLRAGKTGPDFWLVVVHLKAMPDGIDVRREQWPTLVEISAGFGGPGADDRDLVIAGDFNTTGPPGTGERGPKLEQAELAELLGGAGIRRLSNATGCTAYYDGERRDAWKEPSEIDLLWVRELRESLEGSATVFSGTHCAAQRCEDFRSTDAYPMRDYEFVSDHCPVVLDLVRADDD